MPRTHARHRRKQTLPENPRKRSVLNIQALKTDLEASRKKEKEHEKEKHVMALQKSKSRQIACQRSALENNSVWALYANPYWNVEEYKRHAAQSANAINDFMLQLKRVEEICLDPLEQEHARQQRKVDELLAEMKTNESDVSMDVHPIANSMLTIVSRNVNSTLLHN